MNNIIEGHGAFCFPFITIHESTKELSKPPISNAHEFRRKIKVNYELPSFKILVSDDGFFGVLSINKEAAKKILNIIFATLLVDKKMGAEQISDDDLIPFRWEENTDEISFDQLLPTQRNHIALERDSDETFHRLKFFVRNLINEEEVKPLLKVSYEFSKNSELSDDLILLAEGWSLYSAKSFNAAYLYSWMLIEAFLDRLWRSYITTIDRTSDERENLKSHRNWSVYHHIEVFSFIDKMNSKTRKLLTHLRRKRNEIIHDRHEATNGDVLNCLETAYRIIRNQLSGRDWFHEVPN